jgi:hypothetical protein
VRPGEGPTGWPKGGPRDEDSRPSATIPARWIVGIVWLSRLSRTTKVLYKTGSSPIR